MGDLRIIIISYIPNLGNFLIFFIWNFHFFFCYTPVATLIRRWHAGTDLCRTSSNHYHAISTASRESTRILCIINAQDKWTCA